MRASYRYVGPERIAERAPSVPAGLRVESPADLARWVQAFEPNAGARRDREVIATFVIDEDGWLLIADRRGEHVACAGGRPVRSAGEIAFVKMEDNYQVTWVTNQSTGYCPEPESWPAVERALARAGLAPPEGFTRSFDFRRCPCCGSIHLVKNDVFECAVCSSPLPRNWNFAAHLQRD